MASDRVDLVVVGGGIVGLATALRLLEARSALRLALLEKEPELASGEHVLHVHNAPSPAATAALAIGRELVTMAVERFGI